MSLKDKVLPKGPQFVEFVADAEPWAQYRLEDGAVMRVRPVLVKAIVDGIYTKEDLAAGRCPENLVGYPRINFQFQQMMDITWTPEQDEAARGYREGK